MTTEAKTKLVEFENAPFPFDSGVDPRRRKVSPEHERYSDPRVLLHIPKGFDVRKRGVIVIFFHGHRATITRDVLDRQRVADQISLSHANAVLVAPQFAVNASDSSAGNFWTPGVFKWFLQDVSTELSFLHGNGVAGIGLRDDYDKLDIMVVGYSGGFAPVAWAIHHGGANERMRGVVLLDALYGELDKFEKWILGDRQRRFFVSGYLGSTRARNLAAAEDAGRPQRPLPHGARRPHHARQHHLHPRQERRAPQRLCDAGVGAEPAGGLAEQAAGIPAVNGGAPLQHR